MHFPFLAFLPPSVALLVAKQTDAGNQTLCVSMNYAPGEIVHLELKHYHKL